MYKYFYNVGRQTTEEKVKGYIDTFSRTYQVFYRQKYITIGFLKIKLKKEILFKEEIPQDILIEIGCFGSTQWKTSCPEDIFKKCSSNLIESL